MKLKTKLKKLGACKEAIDWVGDMTLKEAWSKCERGDWMLWFYQKKHPNKIRQITLAKGHCANTVRHLMKDERSKNVVDVAIAFGEGKASKKELAYAASAANAAVYAASFAAADAKNRKETADICRKYLNI